MSEQSVQSEAFAIELARLCADYKCEDVTVMDLRGLSAVTDFTVIATGTSERQMQAVSEKLTVYAKSVGNAPYGVSGKDAATWVLLDFVDVVVHLFAGPYRSYYDLELLWGDASRLEWAKSESV